MKEDYQKDFKKLNLFFLSNSVSFNWPVVFQVTKQVCKNLKSWLEVKNFSYIRILFKENLSMESKIIEYWTMLLHKYKVEQAEVMSRLLSWLFLSWITRTFGQIEHIHFPYTFSHFFHSYNITSLENICPITLWKYTKHPIRVLLKISTCSFKNT